MVQARPHGILSLVNDLENHSGPATITSHRVVRKYAIIMLTLQIDKHRKSDFLATNKRSHLTYLCRKHIDMRQKS